MLRRSSIQPNFTKAVFCVYLKRIIVIPAVYPLLALLNQSLKYGHWADVANYTHHFWLAVRGVFVKQSEPPSYCPLYSRSYEHKRRDPFYLRYGANMSSSLSKSTPSDLGLLTLDTSAGSRYRYRRFILVPFSRARGTNVTPFRVLIRLFLAFSS